MSCGQVRRTCAKRVSTMKPRYKKILIAGIAFAAVALGITAMVLLIRHHHQFWEGTAQTLGGLRNGDPRIEFPATILPPAATDIHYHTNVHTHYYASFHVSEQEFLNWATQIESTSIARNAS